MDSLVTYEDLSKKLKVAVPTLQTWVRRRQIPYIKVGPGTVRFDPDVIDHWLASRSYEAQPPNEQKGE